MGISIKGETGARWSSRTYQHFMELPNSLRLLKVYHYWSTFSCAYIINSVKVQWTFSNDNKTWKVLMLEKMKMIVRVTFMLLPEGYLKAQGKILMKLPSLICLYEKLKFLLCNLYFVSYSEGIKAVILILIRVILFIILHLPLIFWKLSFTIFMILK